MTIEDAYKKYIEPEFIPDERYPLKEFCEYFKKPQNHIVFNDDYLLAWTELSNDVKWIIFFVVDSKKRGAGFGSSVAKDWLESNNRPRTVIDVSSKRAYKFWEKRLGEFKKVPNYKYVQPALFPGMNPVDSLVLATNFETSPAEMDMLFREYYGRERAKQAAGASGESAAVKALP